VPGSYRVQCPKFQWAVVALIVAIFLYVTSIDRCDVDLRGLTGARRVRRNHFQVFFWSHYSFVL
jgi:hypothetical protein